MPRHGEPARSSAGAASPRASGRNARSARYAPPHGRGTRSAPPRAIVSHEIRTSIEIRVGSCPPPKGRVARGQGQVAEGGGVVAPCGLAVGAQDRRPRQGLHGSVLGEEHLRPEIPVAPEVDVGTIDGGRHGGRGPGRSGRPPRPPSRRDDRGPRPGARPRRPWASPRSRRGSRGPRCGRDRGGTGRSRRRRTAGRRRDRRRRRREARRRPPRSRGRSSRGDTARKARRSHPPPAPRARSSGLWSQSEATHAGDGDGARGLARRGPAPRGGRARASVGRRPGVR